MPLRDRGVIVSKRPEWLPAAEGVIADLYALAADTAHRSRQGIRAAVDTASWRTLEMMLDFHFL